MKTLKNVEHSSNAKHSSQIDVKRRTNRSRWIKFGICLAGGIIVALIPTPTGLTANAWYLFAIFVSTALGFVLRPFATGIVTVLALTTAMVAHILTIDQAFMGFSSDTIWLIVAAFLFSRGLIKTRLGERIAYKLLELFGSSSLKLAYTLSLGDLIISTIVPSNTARTGGIFFPIVQSVAKASGSEPKKNPRRLGAFLMQTMVHGDNVASALTITAMAGNLLIVGFASKIANVHLTWGIWILTAIVPAIVSFIVQPLFLYKVYPPELKKTPEAKTTAAQRLAEMGPISRDEKVLGSIFALTIVGWATTSYTNLGMSVVALAGLSLMLLFGVLEWSDVTHEASAWNVMFWMGGMFGLATNLSNMKVFNVFADFVAQSIKGISWPLALLILIVVFALTDYGFASGIAHDLAMYPAFLTVAIAIGVPPFLAVMSLAFTAEFIQMLTHYTSGPAAIYFGAGYMSQGTWWRLGIEMLVLNLAIWGTVGLAWWKILGFW